MGSILRKDKIGSLQHSGGNILLGPSILTIGGRQLETTSQIQVALPVMTANTRYQVFAVQAAGVVSLVISQNENSQGPAGESAWKLVGSFYADGSGTAFGAFVSISGTPVSGRVSWEPSSFNSLTTSSVDLWWWREGKNLHLNGTFVASNNPPNDSFISMPTNFTIDVSDIPAGGHNNLGRIIRLTDNGGVQDLIAFRSIGSLLYNASHGISNITFSLGKQGDPTAAFAQVGWDITVGGVGNRMTIEDSTIPVSSFNNTAIEDL